MHIEVAFIDPFYGVQGKFSEENHKWTRINTKVKKEEATTDDTDYTDLGSARGSYACLKAWPSLRVRCSGALGETTSRFHHGGRG